MFLLRMLLEFLFQLRTNGQLGKVHSQLNSSYLGSVSWLPTCSSNQLHSQEERQHHVSQPISHRLSFLGKLRNP